MFHRDSIPMPRSQNGPLLRSVHVTNFNNH